jgi:subtilisin
MILLIALMVSWTSVARAEERKIVMFLDGVSLPLQQLIVTLTGSEIIHVLSLINALAIELPLGDTLAVLNFLLGNPAVIGVFDDPLVFADGLSSVAAKDVPQEESYDWGQNRIGVPAVHRRMPGLQGAGVKIAVLDTGADVDHPDLRIEDGLNAMRGGRRKSYQDDHGHGTHVTGIIAARMNGRGIVGVAPEARIIAVKVLADDGSGHVSDLINGLQWAHEQRIRVVNMSLGFYQDSVPLKRAVRRLYKRGMIMVAAAGNRPGGSATSEDGGGTNEGGGDAEENDVSACDTSADGGGTNEGGGDAEENDVSACDTSQLGVAYPARYPGVIAVAATDYNDSVTDYSLSGPQIDVAAPGGAKGSEMILSTNWDGGYALTSGTSQATPHVSGSIALALQRKSDLSFEEVLDLLQRTTWDLGYPEERQGAGLIDVPNLVEALE